MNQLLYSMILGTAVVVGGCIILAASWYDLRAAARRTRLAAIARRLRGNQQPLVAVLIDARHASLLDLTTSLDSIVKSRYKRLSICVVDTQPTPLFKQIVATYRRRRPTIALRHYAPRQPQTQTSALRLAYQRGVKHDLIFTLIAGDTLSPNTIKQAVAHFSDDPKLATLQLARRSQLSHSFSSLLRRYNDVGRELLQKATPRLPRRTPSRLQANRFYRHDYFMARKQLVARQTRYAASLIISSPATRYPETLYTSIATWLVSASALYLLTFVFITAATLQSSSLLLLTWASMCAWTLTGTWTETSTSLQERFALTYSILLTPLLTYFQAIWQVGILTARTLGGLIRQWHRTRRNTYRDRYERYVLDNILAFKAWYEWVCPRELWYQDQRRTDD